MSLKKNKDLKLYFSISEVAQMFDVNESTPSLLGEGVRYHQSKEDEQRYPFFISRRISMRYAAHLPPG